MNKWLERGVMQVKDVFNSEIEIVIQFRKKL